MNETEDYPLVSIIVLNWNGLENTKTCLKYLRQLDYSNYEIIIVDNGSNDGSKNYLKNLKGIVYIDNPVNRGFTGGHIDGFKAARGEYIVLLNNDAVMKADYVRQALKSFADEQVGAVGGRAYFWNKTDKLFNEANLFYSYQEIDPITGEARTLQADNGQIQEVNNVSGSCVMVRKSVIDKFGYLYNRFFAYFEETDLFARFKRAGYKVLYDPQLHIWHQNAASSKPDSKFFYYQIFRNRCIFAIRNFEARDLWRFWLNYTKLSIKSGIKAVIFKRGRTMNKAYFQAFLYNCLWSPVNLLSRFQLNHQLGKSKYNSLIRFEQIGLSIVIDATRWSAAKIIAVMRKLKTSRLPLDEYILVVKIPVKATQTPGVRYIIDRGYFKTNPLNLGCVVARFDMTCLSAGIIDTKKLRSSIVQTRQGRRGLVGFRQGRNTLELVVFNKAFFHRVGGLMPGSLMHVTEELLQYGRYARQLTWEKLVIHESTAKFRLKELSSKDRHTLKSKVRYDHELLKAERVGWYDRAKNRYYRLYQLSTFARWVFMPSVSFRLRTGRLKNILLGIMGLNTSKLKTEFLHIRNEVWRSNYVHHQLTGSPPLKTQVKQLISNYFNLPVFIICRDRLEPLKKQVAWLEEHGFKHIVFIDNDSLYPPLLEYYRQSPYQLLSLGRNIGQTAPWSLSIIRSLVPDKFYIVTDPDVIPIKECPDDFITQFLNLHEKYEAYQKVGFGLKIDDLPDYYPLKQSVVQWEKQFFKTQLEPMVYEAGVDTTFALYKPFVYRYILHPSLRTGHPYMARHLPWYINPATKSTEEEFYRKRVSLDVTSWNTDILADRYKKELKN